MKTEEIEKSLAKLEALEKRVKYLEDVDEIQEIMAKYIENLLVVNWDGVLNCFAENAAVDIAWTGLRKGKAAISKLFREEICNRHLGKEHFFAIHPIITVDGDHAKATWTVYFMMTEGTIGPVNNWQQGPYKCEYVKENGKWKISLLHWRYRVGIKPEKLIAMYGEKNTPA